MGRAGNTTSVSSFCVVVVLGVAATSGAFAWTIRTLSRLYVNAPYQKPFAIGTALLLTAGAFALNKFLDNISFKVEDANEVVQAAGAETHSTLPDTKHWIVPGSSSNREGRDGVRCLPSENHSTLPGTNINPTAAGATSTGCQGAPLSGNQSTGTSTVNFTVPGRNNVTGSITGQITGNGNFTAAGATSTGGQGAPLSGNQSTGTSTVNFTVPGRNNVTGSITGQITGNGNFTGPTSPLSSTLPGTTINPTAAGATSTGGQGAPLSGNQSTGTSTVNITVTGWDNVSGRITGQMTGNGNFTGPISPLSSFN